MANNGNAPNNGNALCCCPLSVMVVRWAILITMGTPFPGVPLPNDHWPTAAASLATTCMLSPSRRICETQDDAMINSVFAILLYSCRQFAPPSRYSLFAELCILSSYCMRRPVCTGIYSVQSLCMFRFCDRRNCCRSSSSHLQLHRGADSDSQVRGIIMASAASLINFFAHGGWDNPSRNSKTNNAGIKVGDRSPIPRCRPLWVTLAD
jgi:hypothetical protein